MDFLTHLDGTSAVGADQPSIFEIYANYKMNQLLYPAFNYMMTQLTQQYYYLLPIYKFKSVVYVSIMSFVEYSYLKEWGGSFTETFYGLKRHKKSRFLYSLLELVWAPLIKSKLDEYYRVLDLTRDMHEEQTNFTIREWSKKIFLSIYPLIHFVTVAIPVSMQIAFVYGYSKFHSPWQYITGLYLKRLTSEDFMMNDKQNNLKKEMFVKTIANKRGGDYFVYLLRFGLSKFFKFVSFALPTGIFVFRFFEWWYASEHSKEKVLPIPPPPEFPKRHPDGLIVEFGKCPICKKEFVNAATAYGYVYCYPCIHGYSSEYRKCPVTFMPLKSQQIRKLYQGL
ncbi:Pex12 amino terminal region-domain-containing protein [Globomyces pollinis-pini]|nr:Pex12 amino terminal region-domain-containing protein [Globomyces pollinis-pini]